MANGSRPLAEGDKDENLGIPMILVLNKIDLVEEHINQGYKLEEYMT